MNMSAATFANDKGPVLPIAQYPGPGGPVGVGGANSIYSQDRCEKTNIASTSCLCVPFSFFSSFAHSRC